MVLRAYVQELRISWAELELLILLKTLSFSYATTIFTRGLGLQLYLWHIPNMHAKLLYYFFLKNTKYNFSKIYAC